MLIIPIIITNVDIFVIPEVGRKFRGRVLRHFSHNHRKHLHICHTGGGKEVPRTSFADFFEDLFHIIISSIDAFVESTDKTRPRNFFSTSAFIIPEYERKLRGQVLWTLSRAFFA
ncbi:hypothetical protein CDAR_116211 [Caerostris darwini]|uniref:Uncharacterized protein n=1 Tax=Caerostris darwini TaxID=1538125 RepID=A0AAV4SM06_9ARAC|nr:hypothetical protein CDAR_116211 [Caerostris darwini]